MGDPRGIFQIMALLNLAQSCQNKLLQDALARSCPNDRLTRYCKHMHLAKTKQDDLQEFEGRQIFNQGKCFGLQLEQS